MKKILITSIIILTILNVVKSQYEEIPELITDRPDQTESASTVPRGFLQIETGFVKEVDESIYYNEKNIAWNSTLFRLGILENWECRFGFEYLDNTITDNISSIENQFIGFSPIFIGTKILIAKENGCIPQLAFLGHLTLPGTGKEEFSIDYIAPDFRFAFEYTIAENISIGANIGSEWNGNDLNSHNFYSLVLGIGLLDELGVYIETYGYIIERSFPDHRADFGFTYSLKDNFQLDASAGIGMNDLAPDRFISAGLSWRIPN